MDLPKNERNMVCKVLNKLKAKTTRNTELGGRTISWIPQRIGIHRPLLGRPRDRQRGVGWYDICSYAETIWMNLSHACLALSKSKADTCRMQIGCETLWAVLQRGILAIFSIADQDYRTACETWSNASLADVQRFPSPQTSPDAQCSRGPNGPDPGADGLFDNPAGPARCGG